MRLLDLFCCAGGAGEGYRRAGFKVTGIDIEPQPHNPHSFIQADALEYVQAHGAEFDAIHASPPCQAYSMAAQAQRNAGKLYPDLLDWMNRDELSQAIPPAYTEFIGKHLMAECLKTRSESG